MATSKPVLLMLMIACLSSAALAILLSIYVGSGQMLITAAPGFIIGAFFAFKYALFDRSAKKQEEHRRNRNRHKH